MFFKNYLVHAHLMICVIIIIHQRRICSFSGDLILFPTSYLHDQQCRQAYPPVGWGKGEFSGEIPHLSLHWNSLSAEGKKHYVHARALSSYLAEEKRGDEERENNRDRGWNLKRKRKILLLEFLHIFVTFFTFLFFSSTSIPIFLSMILLSFVFFAFVVFFPHNFFSSVLTSSFLYLLLSISHIT